MESGGTSRGYRSHMYSNGERRSRSPGYRRVTSQVSPVRRSHPYVNHENDSYGPVKGKLNEDVTPSGQSHHELHHGSLVVTTKEDSRRHSVLQNAHDPSEADLTELMTFRTFMITSVDESCDPLSSVKAYEAYKKDYEKRYTEAVHWVLRDIFIIAERYNPALRLRQIEETTQRCRQEASQFIKLMLEERFFGISFVDKFSPSGSGADNPLPFQVNIGQALANYELVDSSLRAPFWFPPDPNVACLCLKNVPLCLSKWDIVDHLAEIEAADGLLDVTPTPCKNFLLSYPLRKSPANNLFRDVWIKFSSDEACAACDVKLDGTRCKDVVCRPVRRVPNPSSYTLRVAPYETCHPVRILRDLHISARLILKLDKDFGVSEILNGHVTDMEKEPNEVNMVETSDNPFYQACSSHPVLADFLHVILNRSGRSAEEQLDLQLLYLRMVHNVCYYSGRRFTSARELWNEVGTLYVRPNIQDCPDVNVFLPGFVTDHEGWDKDYIEAEDVWNVSQNCMGCNDLEHPREQKTLAPQVKTSNEEKRSASYADVLGGAEFFLEKLIPNAYFEPQSPKVTTLLSNSKYEDDQEDNTHLSSMCNGLLQDSYVKVEDTAEDVVNESMTMNSNAAAPSSSSCPTSTNVKPSTGCEETFDSSAASLKNFPRGRSSPWLQVLDTRLRWLLAEKNTSLCLDENSPEFIEEWDAFCESVVEKYYDAEHDMEKWACPSCSKQFRGLHFVKNHLKHKHRQCYENCLSRATEKLIRSTMEADPYKLPVALPSPTPYLYRMKNFRLHKRQDANYVGNYNFLPLRHGHHPLATFDSSLNAMNQGVGPRLNVVPVGPRPEPSYRDWDAPVETSLPVVQGNLRTCVLYDDL